MDGKDDTISRQAAIDAIDVYMSRLCKYIGDQNDTEVYAYARGLLVGVKMDINTIPSAQPEVIRCRECKFASGDSRICMKFGHSPIGELDFCAWAERIPNEREDTIREGDGTHEDGH